MATDNYPVDKFPPSLTAPGTRHFSVTAANSDLAIIPRGLYVGGEGDLVVTDASSVKCTYPSFSGWFPFRPVQVNSETTATGIIGIY